MLAAASGNILDDEDLINALALSKKTSSAINLRLTEAETTTQEINAIREQYRVVATRGSVIYFVVAAMNDADPMYSYSMQFYKGLVLQRLQRTEKQSVLADRLGLLIADLTRAIYLNVCRGVFEKDKLLFSFLIAVRIQQAAGVVLDAEWQVFIRGIAPVDEVIEAHPLPVNVETAGISKRQWFAAVMLQHVLIHFSGLCAEISSSPKEWAYWFECETPETDKLPCNFDDKLGVFSRLLLIRVLREEKTIFATNRYVGEALGVEFTESPSFDLMGAFEDSSAATPLIFILSAGADPTDYLQQLAAVKGKKVNMISLGQGQGPNATRTVIYEIELRVASD
jgi:dynein heavy chain